MWQSLNVGFQVQKWHLIVKCKGIHHLHVTLVYNVFATKNKPMHLTKIFSRCQTSKTENKLKLFDHGQVNSLKMF